MDSLHRHENLDARIAELSNELHVLQARRDALGGAPATPAQRPNRAGLFASVLLVAAGIVAAAALYRSDSLAPVEKAAVGYAAAVAGLAYGLFSGSRQGLVSQTAFGLGLAAAYLTTYGTFYLSRMKLIAEPGVAVPVLAGAMVAVLLAAHLRRSSAAATLAFAAVFFTAPITVWHGTLPTVGYALSISCAGAAAALLLQAHRGWVAPTWTAFVGAYTTAALYLMVGDSTLNLSPDQHLRVCLGYLAIVFVVIATAALVTARSADNRLRGAALLALANTVACYLLGRTVIAHYGTDDFRVADFAFAAALGVFAVLSAVLAPRRERLTEAFLAGMVLVLCWAIGTRLSDAALWIAPAAACLVLALAYARTGVVFLKALNVPVLALTFAASLWAIHWKGNLALEEYQVVSNWLVGCSAPATLALAAAVYARFTRHRVHSTGKRWLFEGGIFDVAHAHMALLHAAAGILILLTLTVFRLGDNPILPYIVAAEAVGVVVLGYLLATPSIRMAGVALLCAAHVVYYFFVFVPQGVSPDANGIAYPLTLAAATLYAGMLWERQVKHSYRLARPTYDPVSTLPYLLAVLLTAYIVGRYLPDLSAPLVLNAIGLGLFVAALLVGYGGLKAAALFAYAAGTALFLMRLRTSAQALPLEYAAGMTGAFLATIPCAERLLARLERNDPLHGHIDAGLRSLLILAAAALAVVAAYTLVPRPYLTVSLLAASLVLALLAAALRESRYTWPALTLFALGAGRCALYDFRDFSLAPSLWAAGVGAAAVAALLVAWLRRRPQVPSAAPKTDQAAHGHTA